MNKLENYYNELLHLSGTVFTVVTIIPIIVGFIYYKTFNKPIKVFFGYLLFGLVMNIFVETFIWSVNIPSHYNNFWKAILDALEIEDTNFFNGFSYLASFLFLGWFYYLVMKSAKYSYLLKWFCVALCLFQVFNYFFIDGFRTKGAVGLITSGIYATTLPALYLWYLSNKPPDLSIWKNAYFWISGTLFIISTISLVYSFSAETLYESDFVLYCKTKIVRNGVNILGEIAFLTAFTKAKYLKYI